MSMDGVDLALARIDGEFPHLRVELEGTHSRSYAPSLRARLEAARYASATEVCALNVEMAAVFAECVLEFLSREQIDAARVDAIGSHGQTLVHIAPTSAIRGSTLQVGSGQVIAQRTGILTVSNFRMADMAVDGHGAPLVPLADFVLFRRAGAQIAVNNLGSISNVTLVTDGLDDVFAFDTGPANMPIDYFARRVPGNVSGFDMDGALSARGCVIDELLAELMARPFLRAAPPKSAGYEDFGPRVLDPVAARFADKPPLDLLRTAVEFTAQSVAEAYDRWVLPRAPALREVVLTGGGALNSTLVQRIADKLPSLNVTSLARTDVALNRAKEALSFAILANETLAGRAGNLPSVTGARKRVVLGEIALS
jgi:anhydro-N-acetylmuramic acid kinase